MANSSSSDTSRSLMPGLRLEIVSMKACEAMSCARFMVAISSASLTARSLRMSSERSLKRALGMASEYLRYRLKGMASSMAMRPVTSLRSASMREMNSTSRSRDASICQMPSSLDFSRMAVS